MKKLISLFAAASMLTLSAVAVQAEGLVNYMPTSDTYSIEYEVGAGNTGKYYGMVAVEGVDGVVDTTDVSKFVYIDQATANAEGVISFTGFAPKGAKPSETGYKESTVFIGGDGFTTATQIGYLRSSSFKESTDIIISGKAIDTVSSIKLAKITVMDANGKILNDGGVATEANAEGVYAVTVPAGVNYSVVITKDGYLKFTYNNVDAESNTTLKDVTITNLAGDVNENGEIKLDDLLAVLADYDNTDMDESTDNDIAVKLADVNGNKEVKLDDLLALMAGYDGKNVTAEAEYVTATETPAE